jgi:hypothetical protein
LHHHSQGRPQLLGRVHWQGRRRRLLLLLLLLPALNIGDRGGHLGRQATAAALPVVALRRVIQV